MTSPQGIRITTLKRLINDFTLKHNDSKNVQELEVEN